MLTGILFLLKTETSWNYLLKEMSCGVEMTYWCRFRDLCLDGIGKVIWRVLLNELGEMDAIGRNLSAFDSFAIHSVFGRRKWWQSYESRQKWFEVLSDNR